MPQRITPTGESRTFDREGIIVSKTDLKGRITYVNDLLLDVSRYDRGELVGQPHSIFRHPDMPRGLFGLLWKRIQAGNEIFAYIDNLAKDGASYWVLAHVTPTFGARGEIVGYHSNRRMPSPRAITPVSALYDRMCAEERGHSKATDAAAASMALLERELGAAGQTYDEFVWTLISGTGAVHA